ncbi:BglG family transcription antiterminator [Jeotgalibacillus marinus]|uniref:PTS sugar transporter subunit IIA n=1 Tax=Jeotgalibacillus marinus TaxID=86667 RepID=A0ABV3Q3J8_9BACL
MDEKQYKLLTICLNEPHKKFSTLELSEELDCSEKTIRNYFKQLDDWMSEYSSCQVIRKPNQGIWIEGSVQNIQATKRYLEKHRHLIVDREKSRTDLMNILFNETKKQSIKDLSERLFRNAESIKKDIGSLQQELTKYYLEVVIRQKEGISIVGKEADIRAAYVHFLMDIWHSGGLQSIFVFISQKDYELVSHYLLQLLREENAQLTDEAQVQFTLIVLYSIKRIKQRKRLCSLLYEQSSMTLSTTRFFDQIERTFTCSLDHEERKYLYSLLTRSRKLKMSKDDKSISVDAYHFTKWLVKRLSDRCLIPYDQDTQLINPLCSHIETTLTQGDQSVFSYNPMKEKVKKEYYYTYDQIYSLLEEEAPEYLKIFTDSEVAYLTLYFESSYERLRKTDGKNKRVVLACARGMGTSMLLQAKLERKFHSLQIVKTTSFSHLRKVIEEENPDYVICTKEPDNLSIPYIVLSPVLDKDEEQKLINFMDTFHDQKVKYPVIKRVLSSKTIFPHQSFSSPIEAIKFACSELEKKKFVTKEYVETVIQREKLSATTFENGTMIPHGSDKEVLSSVISIIHLSNPILWNDKKVSILFLLALKGDEIERRELFRELLSICEDKKLLQHMRNVDSAKELLDLL